MPSHNKDAKVFGEPLTDQRDELNESDIEVIETLCSEATAVQTTETTDVKPKVQIVKQEKIKMEVKSEFQPVRFSKPKNQGAAKYNRALKAL